MQNVISTVSQTGKLFLCLGIWILLATSCGGKVLELNEFTGYVQRFEEISFEQGQGLLVDDLIIEFDDLGLGNVKANCEKGKGTPRIRIDRESFKLYNDAQRQALIFHELGHCVLDRFHREEVFPNGDPVSIMNPMLIDDVLYVQEHDHYMHELFHSQ